jgi:hypothetical protein
MYMRMYIALRKIRFYTAITVPRSLDSRLIVQYTG